MHVLMLIDYKIVLMLQKGMKKFILLLAALLVTREVYICKSKESKALIDSKRKDSSGN